MGGLFKMNFGWRQITEKWQGGAGEDFRADGVVSPDRLRRQCDISSWPDDLMLSAEIGATMVGQLRAVEAIAFASEMTRPGYNIYVLSPPESGNLEHVTDYLEELASQKPTPSDWVYVHNFKDPRKPMALRLKPGRAPQFQKAVAAAISQLQVSVPEAFESDDYIENAEAIDKQVNARITELQERAARAGMAIVNVDDDLNIVPIKDGEPMSSEAIEELPYEERQRIDLIVAEIQSELDEIVANLSTWERRSEEARAKLDKEVGIRVIDHALIPVAKAFSGDEKMNTYLNSLRADILQNLEIFKSHIEDQLTPIEKLTGGAKSKLSKYQVNCFVTQEDQVGAPVSIEDNPVYGELVGSLRTGTAIDRPDYDFVALHPGAFHEASGGFLIINIEDLLTYPLAWDVVKRTLRSGEIQIDTPNSWYADYDSESIEPEPIPFDGKVILVGDRYLHYRLTQLDSEFADLFKILAEFADDMARDTESEIEFARLFVDEAARDGMLPIAHNALARLVEFSARLAEDSGRLSLYLQPLKDLMSEAEHLARLAHRNEVGEKDIIQAERARIRRLDLLKERSHDYIVKDLIKVETSGAQVGQVNGLVVTGLEHRFGRPCRISARARMGEADRPVIEQVVDIQSESELSGSSHSKGVMVLSGYLQAKFLPRQPLALSATLVFEQSHSFVDGDSASCAELCALLSAIALVPIKQNLAITGAVSQYGDVQVIGGVNEKIEGFFDVCNGRGLTGDQGVIIPKMNVPDLMLRDDVVKACEKGQFHIYEVESVDRALELLTGMRVGARRKGSRYPSGTLFNEVEERLEQFEKDRRKAMRPWPIKARA
jgi:predicted ATP-dependent protease